LTKVTITRTTAQALREAPSGCRTRFNDDRIAGYGARKNRDGSVTFSFRYQDRRGRQREMRIGRHGEITADQARKRALELKAELSRGGDPSADRDRMRAVPTFEAFVNERFVPHVRETIRSHRWYEGLARLRLIPAFGRCRLDEITPAHVAAFRRSLVAEGLSSAHVNRHLAVLRRILNLALRWGLCAGPNPAQSPGMLREEPRELFLTEAQLRVLMSALANDHDRAAASAVALLALTGARKSEILGARWEHVDLGRGILTVPRSKSGRRRYIVLSAAAVAVLQLQSRSPGHPFVFPSTRRPGQPIEGVRAVWARTKTAAALPPETRLHDLRHTFASLCINDAVPLYEVSKLLGHSNQAVTTRYAHLRDDRLLAAANGVGRIATGGSDGGQRSATPVPIATGQGTLDAP
jgi:integrase